MSNSPEPTQESNILGSFASLIGLLGIFLYFTGYIYRWAYFGFFQVRINSLDFPVESFFFIPLQVFLGNFWAFCLTVLAIVALVLLIRLTLWLFEQIIRLGVRRGIRQILRSQLELLPPRLRRDIVIVVWVLVILYWLARYQGTLDAHRDAFNNTSLLPVVTLVTPEKQLALGRNLNRLLLDPTLDGYKIIGDKGLFNALWKKEINDVTNPENPTVWRLLVVSKGWLYLFPALPPKAGFNQSPPVLAIRESGSGDQLMILSPESTKL